MLSQLELEKETQKFYADFANLPDSLKITKELVPYAKSLYEYHSLNEPTITVVDNAHNSVFEPLEEKKALICFSGGADSTAAILWAQLKHYEITLFHVESLNKAASTREITAVKNIAKTVGLENNLVIIKMNEDLAKLNHYKIHLTHSSKANNKQRLLEHPAKNQYIWMLALDEMQKRKCGTIIFTNQVDAKSAASHFSDSKQSFDAFLSFAKTMIGPHCYQVPFATKKEYIKTLMLHDVDSKFPTPIMAQVSSCFKQPHYFKSSQAISRRKYSDVQDNECGSCDKCEEIRTIREDLRLELNLQIPDELKADEKNSAKFKLEQRKINKYFLTFIGLIPVDLQNKFLEIPELAERMKKPFDPRSITPSEFATLSTPENHIKIEKLLAAILFQHPESDFVVNNQMNINYTNLINKYGIDVPHKKGDIIANKPAEHIKIESTVKVLFELFLRCVVMRSILVIRKYKIEFPIEEISAEVANHSFADLKTYQPNSKQISCAVAGRKASDYFLIAERAKAKHVQAAYTPSEKWYSNMHLFTELRKSLKDHICSPQVKKPKKYEGIYNHWCYINMVTRNSSVDQFSPSAVLDAIAVIKHKYSDYTVTSAYDPCGGWADRLVAFLAAPNITKIVYNDVNVDLEGPYKKVVAAYARPEQQVHLLFKPAESLSVDEICPHKTTHDLIFSGLPFFKREKYVGSKQAAVLYPELNTWLNNFLYQTVRVAGTALTQKTGFMVLNIDDYTKDKTIFNIVEPLKCFLKTIPYLNVEEFNLTYPRIGSQSNQRSVINGSPIIVVRRNDKPHNTIPALLMMESPLVAVAAVLDNQPMIIDSAEEETQANALSEKLYLIGDEQPAGMDLEEFNLIDSSQAASSASTQSERVSSLIFSSLIIAAVEENDTQLKSKPSLLERSNGGIKRKLIVESDKAPSDPKVSSDNERVTSEIPSKKNRNNPSTEHQSTRENRYKFSNQSFTFYKAKVEINSLDANERLPVEALRN